MRAHHFVLALAMAASSFASDGVDQSRLMLFIDTTASLSADQYAATAKLASDLVHSTGDYDRVAVYPVGSLGQAPPPVFDEAVRRHVSQRRIQLMRWDLLLARRLSS